LRIIADWQQYYYLSWHPAKAITGGEKMRSEQGFSLIETLIGLAILGLIGVAILSALAAVARSNMVDHNQSEAETLARTQLEYVQAQAYDASDNPPVYTTLTTAAYPGFSFATPLAARIDSSGNVVATESGLQKITVAVKYNTNTLFTLVGYKVNR
jgi:prepilin-type N-terminal cleavage/methylation domain-containing protein